MPSSFHHFTSAILCVCLCFGITASAHEGTVAALKVVDNKLIASPHNVRLHIRRASLLLENEQHGLALEAVSRARELGADSLSLSLVEAKALLALRRPTEVLTTLSNYPPTIPVLALRARALHASGHSAVAIEQCRALLAADPDPDIAFLAAEILVENNDTPAAIILLDTVFPADTRPSSIELRALEYEVSLKSWDSALARTARHISSLPRPEPWIARRAEILTQAGLTTEAASTWQELLTTIRNLPPGIRSSHSMLQLALKARAATDTPPLSTR